ncbi:hypothetical protein SAMN02746062_00268 [Alysiella filiformis DSM 16848]|uniref:Uncharacterized protein n=2 Tax=Alysiella TaxID=194195 RepID=A0A286E398_9NEIS|nr:hypothetical protein SAMN02746062_00268 [Alysiella filiformis DSM 16848]
MKVRTMSALLELIMGLMELLQAIFDSKKQIKHDLRLKGKLSKDSKIILLIWLFAILFLGFVVWFDMVLMNS